MSQVSRPMQVLLLATVLFAAVWFVALRPKPADGGDTAAAPQAPAHEAPSAPGTEGLNRAVDKAEDAVATANGEQADGDAARTGGASATPAEAEPARAAKAVGRARPGDPPEVRRIRAALRDRKAVAIAFVTPTVADARAVSVEMRHVGTFGGRAVTIEAPLSDLSRYDFITREVEVTVAPTIVIVAPDGQATTIVGFADRFEIEQRIADALGQRRS